MLEQEAVEVVKQFDLLVDYEDAILFVLDYVEANAHILGCAYDNMGRDEMKRFFYADFIGIIGTLIDGTEKISVYLFRSTSRSSLVIYTPKPWPAS